MSVWFRNLTPNTVYISLIHVYTTCPERLGKSGWYRVDPGRTALIFRNIDATTMRAFYAEDELGNVWAGNWYTEVPNTAFRWCLSRTCTPGVPCNTLGFRSIAAREDDAIFQLRQASTQRTSKSGHIIEVVPTTKIKKGSRIVIPKGNTVWLNPKLIGCGCSRSFN